jgi:hypothetical protein
MRVEFHEPETPDAVVASVAWNGSRAILENVDEARAGDLERILRATPVVIDDPAFRSPGTSGEVVLQPGSLAWFRAACRTRASDVGLVPRFVPGVREGGYDPAAGSRTFDESIARLVAPPD